LKGTWHCLPQSEQTTSCISLGPRLKPPLLPYPSIDFTYLWIDSMNRWCRKNISTNSLDRCHAAKWALRLKIIYISANTAELSDLKDCRKARKAESDLPVFRSQGPKLSKIIRINAGAWFSIRGCRDPVPENFGETRRALLDRN